MQDFLVFIFDFLFVKLSDIYCERSSSRMYIMWAIVATKNKYYSGQTRVFSPVERNPWDKIGSVSKKHKLTFPSGS